MGNTLPPYVLRVIPTGKKFLHEVIDTDTSRVIGTRTSGRHYRFATVVRNRIENVIACHLLSLSWAKTDQERAERKAALDKALANKADGVVPTAGVYSYNLKPTPLTGHIADCYEQVAIATEI